MAKEKHESREYHLGVKREITTKRGTGTRDQDEVKTTVRTTTYDGLKEISDDVMDNHEDAVEDARQIAQSGGMNGE